MPSDQQAIVDDAVAARTAARAAPTDFTAVTTYTARLLEVYGGVDLSQPTGTDWPALVDEATALMTDLAAAEPDPMRKSSIVRRVGMLLWVSGRKPDGIEQMQQAVAIAPAHLPNVLALVDALRQDGRRDETVAVCAAGRKALRHTDGEDVARLDLMMSCLTASPQAEGAFDIPRFEDALPWASKSDLVALRELQGQAEAAQARRRQAFTLYVENRCGSGVEVFIGPGPGDGRYEWIDAGAEQPLSARGIDKIVLVDGARNPITEQSLDPDAPRISVTSSCTALTTPRS